MRAGIRHTLCNNHWHHGWYRLAIPPFFMMQLALTQCLKAAKEIAPMNARKILLRIAAIALCMGVVLPFVTQPLVDPVATHPPPVDAQALQRHVRFLSVDAWPRSYDSATGTAKALDYIVTQFRTLGVTVELQPVKIQGGIYYNAIAHFGPTQGAPMIIGAHYDSAGHTLAPAFGNTRFAPGTHTPGADDNASGVAALLELARLLAAQPPSKPVHLVAYCLEEPRFLKRHMYGSYWHAGHLRAQGQPVRLMLSLEMLGHYSDAPDSQGYPVPGMARLYSDKGDFVALVGRWGDFSLIRQAKALMLGASDLPVHSMNAPFIVPGVADSDHFSFWRMGMPALMVTDTAHMRNENYHQASDTWDTLDYTRMAKAVQGVYALAQHL